MRSPQLIFILASALLSSAAAQTEPVTDQKGRPPIERPAASEDIIVHQKGRTFSIEALTVARGEPIVFLNDDTVPHNVMSTANENAFDIGSQMPDTAIPVSFTRAGIVMVICAIHPRMHMTITVTN